MVNTQIYVVKAGSSYVSHYFIDTDNKLTSVNVVDTDDFRNIEFFNDTQLTIASRVARLVGGKVMQIGLTEMENN